jgi:hypothetical protein
MIPDDVEKIIMTKEDYDRNVEQLLLDKCKAELEVERLNNIINEFNKLIENEINESKLEDNYERVDSLEYCLATLKELKGSDKE